MKLDLWLSQRSRNNSWLAEQVGVDRSQISRIRRGKQRPSAETARRIIAVTKGRVGWPDLMVG